MSRRFALALGTVRQSECTRLKFTSDQWFRFTKTEGRRVREESDQKKGRHHADPFFFGLSSRRKAHSGQVDPKELLAHKNQITGDEFAYFADADVAAITASEVAQKDSFAVTVNSGVFAGDKSIVAKED